MNGRRALVVDDDPVALLLLEHMTSSAGLVVTTATSVDGALRLLLEETFDIVICDYLMPERTGLDLLDELGNEPPPFILLTGFVHQDELADDRVDGVAAYLTKPVSSAELAEAIRTNLPESGSSISTAA